MIPQSSRPNILILMSDQMQGARIGVVDPVAYTPNIDRLVAEGVHFSHATSCHGQCMPSRAGFIAGKSAHECNAMANTGQFGHRAILTPRHLTLGQVLKDAGYRTAYFGKSHLGSAPTDLGFDVAPECGEIADEEARQRGIEFAPQGARRAHYTGLRDAKAYLADYQPDATPLLMVYSTNLPHGPMFWVPEHKGRFDPEKMVLPRSFYEDDLSGKPPFQAEHAADGRHGAVDEDRTKLELAQYYSMIAAADDHFGQVRAEFERLGIWDNTIVLFFSDHGDMMGGHGMRMKGTLPYEELYHVPCVFKLPAGMTSKRRVIDDLVCSSAFAGTLLALAGIDVPAEFTGGHFADAFVRHSHGENERVFFEHYSAYWGQHPFYGVRTRTAKYIRYYGPDATEEMYDLAADPDEMHNVAADPAYQTLKAELAAEADAWWVRTGGKGFKFYESAEFKANSMNAMTA